MLSGCGPVVAAGGAAPFLLAAERVHCSRFAVSRQALTLLHVSAVVRAAGTLGLCASVWTVFCLNMCAGVGLLGHSCAFSFLGPSIVFPTVTTPTHMLVVTLSQLLRTILWVL